MSSDLDLLLDFFLLLTLGVGEGSAFFLLPGVESAEDSLCNLVSNEAIMFPQVPLFCPGDDIMMIQLVELSRNT